MSWKKRLESIFQNNTFAADWLYRHYQPKREQLIKDVTADLSARDSLKDIQPLKQYKKRILLEEFPFWSYDLNQTESRMYGIHNSLFAGIEDRSIYFPSAEHGLILHNKNWTDTQNTARASCVTFGSFRKEILRKYYDTPIFCVGPYIHYAADYYTETEMKAYKEKLGKNLLIFPTYGTDDAEISYAAKSFLDKIIELRKSFDSISVCVYWWNLDDPIVKVLEKEGCQIVSAGYREDPNFLSRLKAIIDLCDFAIGDGIGTHIGYCLSRGKPFSYFDSETAKNDLCQTDKEDQNFVQKHTEIIKKTFLNVQSIGTQQIEIGRFYWGLDQIKSREDLHYIYQINKKITLGCHGKRKKYGEYARSLLHTKDLPERARQLLLESLEK